MSDGLLDHFDEVDQRVLRYCTTCPKMCRFACPVAHHEARESVTPWGLASLINTAALETGTVEFDQDLVDLLQRCTGCLRCQTACLHDNDIPSLVYSARAIARTRGFDLGPEPSRTGRATSENAFDGRALGFAGDASVAFVPSCELREPLGEGLRHFARLFRAFGLDVTLAATEQACCGTPLLEGGLEGLFRDRMATRMRELAGIETVVTDCDDWLAQCRRPEWARLAQRQEIGQIVHWTELLAPRLERLEPSAALGPVHYHEGCRLVRGAGSEDAPLAVAAWASGGDLRRLADAGARAQCCGAGAGYEQHDPEGARALAEAIAGSLRGVLVSSRPSCARHLGDGADDLRAVSLFELVTLALGWTS